MTTTSWLVIIDMQRIFAEPGSAWCAPDFAQAAAGAVRLRKAFGTRVALTRFFPPDRPEGAWEAYYQTWPFALDPAHAPLYSLTEAFPIDGAVLIDRTTFGKWDAAAREALSGVDEIVLAGVATECCVLATALAAADSGIHVRVAADACAGGGAIAHRQALDIMALYAPLIEITSVDEIFARR